MVAIRDPRICKDSSRSSNVREMLGATIDDAKGLGGGECASPLSRDVVV